MPRHVQKKPSNQIIIVSCYDEKVAIGAAYSLIEEHYADADCKSFFVDPGSHSDSYAHDYVDIDVFLGVESHDTKERVVLIDDAARNKYIIKALMRPSVLQLRATTLELQERRVTIIAVLSGRLLQQLGVDEPIQQTRLTHWHIHFTHQSFLSLRFSHKKGDAAELSRRLDEQWKKGYWPESESLFYEELVPFIESPEKLKEQVERKERGESDENSLRPSRLFPKQRKLEQWILVLVVFFRRLSPANLNWLLGRLLGEDTTEVETIKKVQDEKGEIKEISELISRPLLELYREDPDKVLKSCGLQAAAAESGDRIIVFSTPGIREQLYRFVQRHHPMIVHSLFEKLRDGGMLFDPSLPRGLESQMVRLTVDRSLEDPGYYGDTWLRGSLIGMKTFLMIEISSDDDEGVVISKLIQSLRHQEFWKHFCHRLSEMVREMLRHKTLEATVRQFLQGLLHEREHRAALEIVLFISRDLRMHHQFDLLYWLRQLIEQSPEDLEEEAYGTLLRLTSQSHLRVLDFLDGVNEWLPEADADPDSFSFAQNRSITFIMDFFIISSERVREEDFGAWPSRYALFRGLQEEPESLGRRIERLAIWMHHPALAPVILPEGKRDSTLHHQIIAALLERWAWILEGIRPASEATLEAVELLELWIAGIKRHAGRSGERAMRTYWHWKQDLYLHAVGQIPIDQRIERDQLKRMRSKVLELRQRFMRIDEELT